MQLGHEGAVVAGQKRRPAGGVARKVGSEGVVEDVLPPGGRAAATVELVRRCGGEVVGVAVLMELGFLAGREALAGAGIRDPHVLLSV